MARGSQTPKAPAGAEETIDLAAPDAHAEIAPDQLAGRRPHTCCTGVELGVVADAFMNNEHACGAFRAVVAIMPLSAEFAGEPVPPPGIDWLWWRPIFGRSSPKYYRGSQARGVAD